MPITTLHPRAWCAAVALVVVAGCGGGSDSDGPKISETSAATSAAPSATTPAPVERPADDRSDAGAIAFSAFIIDRVVAVTAGADIDTLLTLATDDCKGCINLAKDVQKSGTVTQQLDGATQIEDAKVIDTSADDSQYLVEQTLVVPAGRKVDTATGEVKETFEPSRLSFRVLMTWRDGSWVLSNYSAKDT